MQMSWKGGTCFFIVFQRRKQEQVRVIIDPISGADGLKPFSSEADIALFTHSVPPPKGLKGSPFIVQGPGEYEVKDVFVSGIACRDERDVPNTLYVLDAEDLRIAHLGMLAKPELSPEQIEQIGNVDILLVPVGGGQALESQEASKIVNQVEPSIVVPMHYAIPGLKTKLAKVDEFLETMGVKNAETLPKLAMKGRSALEETRFVVLTP